MYFDHIRMPARSGRKTKGRSLDVVKVKNSTVVVKAVLCLAHAPIIAMARINGDTKYKSYRDGYWISLLKNCSGPRV